ncbi:TetR family transcriptional regulator [Subtercola sp. PAMC28395]|uniref:TetR/AcrR family transcriptional regulator n=1 Tax=Subtercola sp. PAMC28395 TaxID=2846775 RepID=UPI001C0BF4C2|nr:TetR family transcriptional regulator [Subtercola sp. PAMC28395]QWT24521.1 TetR family transcriptional regulator [Subtercola sp. PAMC28395]
MKPERQRLLDLVIDLILRVGVLDLSMSAISREIGSNNRMLLYYFSSREKLLDEACVRAFDRFPRLETMFTRLAAEGDLGERLYAAWDDLAAPENRPYLVLFFQRFGAAMGDPDRWRNDLHPSTHRWAEDLAEIFVAEGADDRSAALWGTHLLAVWRGMQFALLADAEPARLREAYRVGVDALVDALRR